VVVQGVVDVGGARLGALLDPVALGAAVDPVPAAVGDSAELLDVDVDQVAGRGMFVAHRFRFGP